MLAVDTRPLPRGSHSIGNASTARLACHQEIGDDRDRIRQAHDPPHAFHVGNRAVVDRLRRAAEDRTVGDRRIEHARQPHVDRINRLGGDLSGHIKAPAGLAGELPVARILELHIGGRRHFRRRLGNGAEREFAPARLVRDHAHGGDAFKRRHVPARGRRRNQHFPRGSARLPQIKLRARDRAAGAGRHVAQTRSWRIFSCGETNSVETLARWHSSSSATSIASPVWAPAPSRRTHPNVDHIVRTDQKPGGDLRRLFGGRSQSNGTASDSATAADGAHPDKKRSAAQELAPDVIAIPSAPPPFAGEGAPRKIPKSLSRRPRADAPNILTKGLAQANAPIYVIPLFR